ncbi:MAG: hypothetical protein ACOCTI_06785 [Phycisphaeraceae bacterium]
MLRRKALTTFACLLLAGLLLAPVVAQEVRVITRDDRTIEGELLRESDDEVVLEVRGIEKPIPREQIARMREFPPLEERYQQRRTVLSADDFEGRMGLVSWLIDEQAYELAQQELESLAERFPDRQRVQTALSFVQSAQEGPQPEAARDERIEQAEQAVEAAAAGRPGPDRRLSEEDISRIRTWELPEDFVEQNFPVQVPQPVVDQFLEEYREELARRGLLTDRGDLRRFRGMPGHVQLRMMMAVRARKFYDDVIIRADPPALASFRRNIHRQYLLNYCGTTRCHGSAEAPGGLFFFRMQPNSDRTVYSNFLTLHLAASGRYRMLNRVEPLQSQLLQYGLARDAAMAPHPDVPGWRPQFFSTEDPRLLEYAGIIDDLYPSPRYGTQWKPPGAVLNGDVEPEQEGPGSAGTERLDEIEAE